MARHSIEKDKLFWWQRKERMRHYIQYLRMQLIEARIEYDEIIGFIKIDLDIYKEQHAKNVKNHGGLWPWTLHLLRKNLKPKSQRKSYLEKGSEER